jgi:uncharacterized repeat protein (TIGR03803 family)
MGMEPERWTEIERLYHAALQHAPDQRQKFLQAACKFDQSLRQEVEGLLAYQEQAESFIERPALEIAAQHEKRALERSLDPADGFRLRPGAQLGPYEVVRPLGAGGMGEIYSGRDSRLGRSVALKILSGRMLNQPGIRNRFESEARAISSLNHPSICTLHDIGRENEVDYLVMELVEGETLAQRLKQGPLLYQELLRVAIQISDALDYAHKLGVVHRDLKPGNIMLTERGVKLVDFGLARWRQEAQEFSAVMPSGVISSLTLTGVVLGTPQYMAPEQIERGAVDGRTDIFALGAVIFEMATGQKAFQGKTSSEVTRAILSSEPRDTSNLPHSIPSALDKVVRRCLKRQPAERWQSAGDVVRQLQLLQHQTEVRRVSRFDRAKLVWGGAAVGSAAVAVILTLRLLTPASATNVRFRHDLKPQILYSFPQRNGIGADPQGGVVAGKNGELYGTTEYGGAAGLGTIFELDPPPVDGAWRATVLHSFAGGEDGVEPLANVVVGENGALYGTTFEGGLSGNGTVFELHPPSTPGGAWTEKILYTFTRQNADGAEPGGNLLIGKGGVLYGTTREGGGNGDRRGTVFALKPPGTPGGPWIEDVLYRFTGENGDGSEPCADLVIGQDGALYGTTFSGTEAIGIVFKLKPPAAPGARWTETVLNRFTGKTGRGQASVAGLVFGQDGLLYGTTTVGVPGLGSIFELKPPSTDGEAWAETILHQFTGKNGDGSDAASGVLIGKNGSLYSTTIRGGEFGKGTIFELKPPTSPGGVWTETVLYSFTGRNGDGDGPKSVPRLVLDNSGALYGTTIKGGTSGAGTVFRLPL